MSLCTCAVAHDPSSEEILSNWLPSFPEFLRHVADALVPYDCFVCGKNATGAYVCADCEPELPFHPHAVCPVCAIPTLDGAVCGRCLRRAPAYASTRAVFSYSFPIDRMVQALKYQSRLAVATHLGERLARYGPPPGIDLILPMPLHPRRLRERGFNQAVELARPLARAWGLPLDTALARRSVDTAPQVSLPWAARRGNMREAFACHGTLAGRSVLVIDDVMTTGATLDALARVLREHGAVRVCNLVVARTLAPD